MARPDLIARAEVRLWLERAEELYRTGNPAEAVRLIDEALESEGEIPDEAIILRRPDHVLQEATRDDRVPDKGVTTPSSPRTSEPGIRDAGRSAL